MSVIKENKYIEEKKVASISFTPTHRCNLRCRYCFANHGNNFNGVKRDLEKEVIMASFDFFYNKIFKPYKKIRIDLVGGGENFLNVNAIREILHQASKRDKEYSLWICTNGTIYNDEISKLLIDRKLSLGVGVCFYWYYLCSNPLLWRNGSIIECTGVGSDILSAFYLSALCGI